MVTARGLFRIIRPINSVMVGLAVLVGVAIGGRSLFTISIIELSLSFITGFFLSGSAMAINDYYDREIDAVNEPSRPIPSGEVEPHVALVFSIVLCLFGLGAAYMTSLHNLAIAILASVAMIVYSTAGKKTGLPGNLIVSACIALPFVYGGVISNTGNLSYALLVALIAFLSNTGREVTKGIVDMEGDEASGIKTLAVSNGPRSASRFAVLCYISAIFVSLAPVWLKLVL